jgi:hypothetical protein
VCITTAVGTPASSAALNPEGIIESTSARSTLLPSDFVAHVLTGAKIGEDPEEDPHQPSCSSGGDLGRPRACVVIVDELQAGRNHHLTLLRMTKHSHLMTAAL